MRSSSNIRTGSKQKQKRKQRGPYLRTQCKVWYGNGDIVLFSARTPVQILSNGLMLFVRAFGRWDSPSGGNQGMRRFYSSPRNIANLPKKHLTLPAPKKAPWS